MEKTYLDINRTAWNARTEIHYKSEFYDVESFKKGKSSLNSIELDLLGNIKGKSLIHALCHFGQDSLSLARMGAEVTAFDLSDRAIEKANELSEEIGVGARFINCDYYNIPSHLNEEFDIFFSSYGVMGWLPDLTTWAEIAASHIKKGGRLILVEFHPFVWMYDDHFQKVSYSYFKDGTIETEDASYTEKESAKKNNFISWNHSLSEVMNALINAGFRIDQFNEYDYSPYDCFQNTVSPVPGKFMIKGFENKFPMVYAIEATLTK